MRNWLQTEPDDGYGLGRIVAATAKGARFVATGDGRFVYDPQYHELFAEYHHKDQLGNVRVAFNDRNRDGLVEIIGDNNEVTQVNDFYPFGLEQKGAVVAAGESSNRYRYNGMEFSEELGLYDYGARWYDPSIARWNAVDPAAESFSSLSPYNYCLNNPINTIDPDGAYSITLTGQAAQNFFRDLRSSSLGYSPDDYYLNLKTGSIESHNGESGDKLKSDGLVWVASEGQDFDATVNQIRQTLDDSGLSYSEKAGIFQVDTEEAYAGYQTYKLGKAIQYEFGFLVGGELLAGAIHGVQYLRALNRLGKFSHIGEGGYTYTKMAAKHFDDVVGRGAYKGQAARPFMNSPSVINEIRATGKGVADASFKGGRNWKVSGTFRGSQGTWELGMNPKTGVIYHFNFVKIK